MLDDLARIVMRIITLAAENPLAFCTHPFRKDAHVRNFVMA